MALWDEVVARVSNQKVVALTNPDGRDDPAAINTARAGKAVDDAKAAFRIHAEQVYDDSDPRHVALGVEGVIAYLMAYGGTGAEGAESAMRRFLDGLRALKDTTARARVSPETISRLVPTDDFASGRDVRPSTDRSRFGGITPENPREEEIVPDLP
jgi:hypothetical protein